MKKIYLLLFLCCLTQYTFSQSDLSKEQVAIFSQLSKELEGTYQIQMIDTRHLPTIPLDIFPKIKENRKEDVVSYIFIAPDTRVKILPQSVIDDENFRAVEKIVFINSSEL